ncbi:MAG: SGNH/GDSL hydrolase family protein [Clostridia bacterium]|nr:SGNH/GDSL hydrolase family protein [Clostridia bacterium]
MLNNTAYKLKKEKKLRVAYFGGSITEGAGSSDPTKTCYRALTTAWLKEKYPEADITEIYAAIGGTGTSFGIFRQRQDVIANDPDLVFVELATNDFGDSYDRVLPQIESMLRQMRRELPMTDVVVLISTALMVIEHIEAGGAFESRDAHVKAAAHYGAPVIDFGNALYKRVREEGVPYSAYAPDELHPGDNGYAVMTEYLLGELEGMLDVCPDELVAHRVPEKLHERASEIGDIIPANKINLVEAEGFYFKEEPCVNYGARGEKLRFEGFLETTNGGDSFTFTFEGIGVGFFRTGGDSGADLLVSIDGGDFVINETWDKYDRSFLRLGAAVVTKDLPYGVHTVTVKAPEADEIRVRIGGVFVC